MNTATVEPTALVERPGAVRKPSLIVKFAQRFGVDADKLMSTLKSTAFKQQPDGRGQVTEVTNEEMMSLLIVADQYGLNPFTREIYAFRDNKRGGIVPIVGVDGWIRIVSSHPEYAGSTFAYGNNAETGKLEWIECTMYRRDREHPMVVREYLNENKRDTPNWTQMTSRMLRHRAFIQCARYAFGFVGLYDEDEGRAIIEGTATVAPDAAIADINREVTGANKARPEDRVEEPEFSFVQVKAAIENAVEGPWEAMSLAQDMVYHVRDKDERHELVELAERLAHERADREAKASE